MQPLMWVIPTSRGPLEVTRPIVVSVDGLVAHGFCFDLIVLLFLSQSVPF